MSKLKAHPYADLFPMMTGAELDALAADIAEVGLRQPIVLYGGTVLDGRNRLLACEKAGVEPAFTEHEGDDDSALSLVISLNVQRRDLTAAQRAIVAARAFPLFEANGRKRMAAGGKGVPAKGTPSKSRDDAAAVFKVGKNYVQQARTLLAEAPDLAAQVVACTLSLVDAYGKLQDRRKQVAQKAKDAERVAEYREAVSGGEMTMDEALRKAIEQEREEKEKAAAQADARQHWLKELAALVEWVERFITPRTDEHLAWYTEPDSPGLYEHGITPERLAAAVAQIERARRFTFGAHQ